MIPGIQLHGAHGHGADGWARLVESEARFRVMADCAPVMLWMSGRDANCTFFNKTWLEWTGRPLERELGVGWAEGVLADDFQDCLDTYLDAFVARRAFRMEYRMRRHDGAYRWILDHGVPRFDVDGGFEGFIGSCIDITDLKEAREASERSAAELERRVVERTRELQASLREREVLLREIHHRVKNNLQLISSLFSLQARQHDGARELFQEAQGRVRAIGLVHEKLYGSRNLAAVEFGRYVRELVAAIVDMSGRSDITIQVDIEEVQLSVDDAIPCGLIMNELLTNALRHAFPGGRGGTIRITGRRGRERVALVVADDGVGLPAEVDLTRPSRLGLELVVALASQLGAELELERDRGTLFRLSFGGDGR